MTDEQIKYMVNRFLQWRLPDTFSPDNSVSFDREYAFQRQTNWPVGTNILTASEAEEMVRHVVASLPQQSM